MAGEFNIGRLTFDGGGVARLAVVFILGQRGIVVVGEVIVAFILVVVLSRLRLLLLTRHPSI